VSVVRISGADAVRISMRCVTPWPANDRELTRCRIHAPDHPEQAIDDALVALFSGPKSYTGETVVEIHGHGGTYVPVAIQAALVAAGARPALPGEFTERATLNGKLDLVRAEAIGAVIDARTRASHRAAMHGLSGLLTQRYVTLRSDAIGIEALIAYDIDFPDEDHGPIARERVSEAAKALAEQIHALVATQPASILAQEGAVVVLAGPPNAGKSSLLNALIGEARMIVSDEPGTTRDAVEVLLDLDPWPVRLVDTAGLRSSAGPVERLGIEVSERYLKAADAIVACAENENALAEMERRMGELSSAPIIRVLTKSDLQDRTAVLGTGVHRVSAVSGDGLVELQLRIAETVAERVGQPGDLPPLVTSARQRKALELAERELSLFRAAWSEGALPAPVAATHLRSAIGALDELIGAIDVDEVFSRVFATFCVGK
jgi:tRNA modification GTPase